MTNLIKAPNLKKQDQSGESEVIICLGVQAWDIAKHIEESTLSGDEQILNTIIQADGKYPCVIVDDLSKVDNLLIAPKNSRYIRLIRANNAQNIKEELLEKVYVNIAQNTVAESVIYCDESGRLIGDVSRYIKRIRQGESYHGKLIDKTEPLLSNGDATNKKARAFAKWLNLDLTVGRQDKKFRHYNGAVWEPLDDDDLFESATKLFDEFNISYSANSLNSLIETMKAQTQRFGEQKNELLAFQNGVLNRTTLEFTPHVKENWLTTLIPHDYRNQQESTPCFDNWLDFVCNGDKDKADSILAALYAILTNRHDWQMFFEITGEGGSGKSVFAKLAELLAGEGNTETGELAKLDDELGRGRFVFKTLIICPEQSRYGGDGSGLKSISGGDKVSVRTLYSNAYTAVIKAIVLIVNNDPTSFTDRAGGIERRRVSFAFNRVVQQNERDPLFFSKLKAEVSGIIYKLIHKFENPDLAKKALIRQMKSEESIAIKSKSDPITEFCGYFETIEECRGLYVGNAMTGSWRTHLYKAYLDFVEASKIKYPLSLSSFRDSVKQGLAQHNNINEYRRKKTNSGYITNVIFKNAEEFKREFGCDK